MRERKAGQPLAILPLPGSPGISGLAENRGEIYAAQYFRGKILEHKNLGWTAPHVFLIMFSQNIAFKVLTAKSDFLSLQNLERVRLTRKIFQNKDLGFQRSGTATPCGYCHDRTSSLWKARSDVTMGCGKPRMAQ